MYMKIHIKDIYNFGILNLDLREVRYRWTDKQFAINCATIDLKKILITIQMLNDCGHILNNRILQDINIIKKCCPVHQRSGILLNI